MFILLCRLQFVGKFIIGYVPTCGVKEYYIGSACEELYAPPSAYIGLYGFLVQASFLSGESVTLGCGKIILVFKFMAKEYPVGHPVFISISSLVGQLWRSTNLQSDFIQSCISNFCQSLFHVVTTSICQIYCRSEHLLLFN